MADNAELTLNDVRHVAKLARLHMSDAAAQTLTDQLTGILHYVQKLQEVDVADTEPTAHPLPLVNVMRNDDVGPSLSTDEVLANAPDADPPFFKVPKVIGGDEDSAG